MHPLVARGPYRGRLQAFGGFRRVGVGGGLDAPLGGDGSPAALLRNASGKCSSERSDGQATKSASGPPPNRAAERDGELFALPVQPVAPH